MTNFWIDRVTKYEINSKVLRDNHVENGLKQFDAIKKSQTPKKRSKKVNNYLKDQDLIEEMEKSK